MDYIPPIFEVVLLNLLAVLGNVILLFLVLQGRKKESRFIRKTLFGVVFIGYFFALWYVTFGSREQFFLSIEIDAFRIIEYSWRLLKRLGGSKKISVMDFTFYLRTINEGLLNIWMFIPIGYIIPSAFHRREWSLVRLCGLEFGCSLFIELMQLFSDRGTFDLGDLLHNTLGAFLGGMIYLCAIKNETLERVNR